MEENYSQELYDWISATDNTFAEREPFEEWSIKVGEDTAYAQELYDWISSVDNTFAEREPFEEWSIKVKKKDNLQPTGEQEVMVSDTEEVEQPGSSVPSATNPEQNIVDSNEVVDETIITQEEPEQSINSSSYPDDLTEEEIGGLSRGEEDTAIERALGKNEFTDFFGDMWRAGSQGQAQGDVVDNALEIFGKGTSASDQDIEEFIIAHNAMAASGPSDEMKDFDRVYEAAGGGIFGFLKGLIESPTLAPQLFVSSISAMVNPASLAAAGATTAGFTGVGAMAGGIGAIPGALLSIPFAMGAAGATLETGLSFAEFLNEELKEKGLKFTREDVKKVLNDPEAMLRIRAKAAGRGAVIGIIDRYTAGLGGKLVGGMVKSGAKKGARILAAAGVEAAGGSAGEAAARLAVGQEMDIKEIGFEGIAGMSTTPVTYAYGTLLAKPVFKVNDGVVDRARMLEMINTPDNKAFAGMKLEIKNDPELKAIVEARKTKLRQESAITKQLKEAGITDEAAITELTALEREKQALEGNTTRAGKLKLKEIDAKIDAVMEGDIVQEVEVTREEARESLKADNEMNALAKKKGFPAAETVLLSEENIENRRQELIKQKQESNITEENVTNDNSETSEVPIPIRNRPKTKEENNNALTGIEAEAGEKLVEKLVQDGIKKGQTLAEIQDRILRRFGWNVNEAQSVIEFIQGKMDGVITNNFATWRKGTKKNNQKTKTDAIQESSTESVDVQERTEDSQEVGDGNAQGDITQESIESEADTETQSQEKIVDGEVGNIFTGNRGTEVIIKKTKNLTITESKSETVDPNAQKKFGLKGTTKIYQQVYGDRMNGTDPVPMLHIYPNTSIITGKKITQDQIQTQEEIDTESRDLESFLNDNDVVVEETEALQTDETVVEAVTPDTDGNLKIIESIKGSQVTLPGQKVNNTLSITDKTTTENDSYYSSDKFTQQNPNTTVEKHESKILKLANKAVKAIAKILPNTKIVIHRSEAAYNKFVTGKGTKGTFDPNTNTIHINMPKANAKTIAHEIFHAVLYDRFGSDIKIAEVTKRMFDAVNRKITDKKLKKELQDFSDRYSEFQNEEYLSELVGILADNYPSLSTPEKSIIKRWLVKLGSMIGISPEIDTDADVLNLLDTIGKSVKEGKEITSADIKQLDMFEGGQQVDNPSTALKNQKIGDFEITYTEDKKIADYIKEELITEPKNILDVFKGLDISNVEVLIHSPDDMLAGEIKYKGETIFEGSGGVFFVTKFKEVWASTEDAANQIVKGLNKQIDEQGKAFMLLAKGTDQKLMSSAGGVDGAMKILDLMLDNKIFSASEFRAAVSKAISQEQSRLTTKAKKDKKPAPKFKPFKLRKSAKDIKNDIVKLFSDESSGTFETRGNIVKGIGNALASAKLNPEQQSRAAEFLGGDTTRRVGVSSTVQKKTGKALSQGLSDLIALVLAENLTKGLKTGDIYAVIEVNQKVKPEKSTHPSYNTTIVTEDGKPPVLHLLKNRQPGKEVLTPNFGEYNNSPYKPGQVPTMTGQINLDKTTVADREQKTTKQRQQKAGVDKLAKMYNMESNGVILAKPGIDRVALEEWANSLGFKIKTTKGDRGQTTSYQLMKNGKRYKPGDEKKSQRQQVSDVLNKDMSAVEIINVARANNFRGPAIKDYLVRVKKMKVKEVNALLKVPLTMFSSIPEAFTNIKEGMNEGVKFYTDILKKTVTWQIKNKATDAQAFDKAVQLLEESKIFQNQADKNKKSLSTLQKEMIVGMQKSLGIRPMKNTNLKLRVLRQSLKDTKRGAKELKSVQSKLRNFIRRSLPKKLYTKGEITTLISDVTNATEANIDNLIQKVIDKITTIQVADLESTIEKLMDDNYEKTESGREKGKKIIVDVNDRLKALKKDMVTDSMVADDVVKRNLELNQEFNEITNKSEQLSEGDLNRLIDLAVLINLNNATLMNNTDVNKVESLNKAAELLTQIVGKGKELFKAQLKKDHQKYLKNKETLYEQVTGEKIDMSDPDQVAKAKKAETKGKARKNKRESDGLLKKSVRGLQLAMSSFFKGSESLSGLMNIIDRLPGELIGGKVREMVYGLLNESTRVYKARKKGNKQIIEAKLKEIFGKKWKSGISAMRKPIDWSATKDIFIDEKEVNEAKKLVEENPTRENKKNLKKVIAENTIVMSQDEILYQYQQFQDPANLASFMNENNFLYRGDPKRILESLMEQVDPKNKEVADWMVEEFYPSLYEHYNKTYKAIYRTNLPWNDKYAGRIYREASAPNPLDLLGTDVKSNNQVSAASTKVRRMNDKPIVKMGMMDVMMTYTTDMEWFASHAEAIRDINKMFDDPLIAQAIEQNNGEGTLLLIRDSIQKIARRGINNAARGKFMNAVNNMFIAARLGANPTIFLKQMTSFITYANDIGIVNYMKYAAINKTEALKVYKEIWNNSVYVQDRASERIQDVLESYTSLGNVEFSTKENYITKLMMSPVKYGDLGAIFLGGSPNYSFYKAQAIKAGKTEAQAIEIAIRKFENDTKNTQQSSDLQDKDYYQTADPVVRAFNMFLTTPKQYLRKEFGAIRNLYRKLAAWDRKAGQGTVVQNVRQLAMYHFVMPLFFQFVAMGFPDLGDLEDEEKEDLLRAGILGNFNALFIAGDVLTMIADAVQEKPWAGTTKSLAPLNVMSEIANLYTRAEKTKDPVKRAELTQKMMLRITEVALTPTGKNLPLVNIAKYVKNLNELGEGGSEKDFMRLFNYSKYVIDKEGKDKGTKLSKKEMQLYFPDLYEQEMALDKELKALDKELELELDF